MLTSVLPMGFSAPAIEDAPHPERVAQIETIKNTPGVTWTAAPHPRYS